MGSNIQFTNDSVKVARALEDRLKAAMEEVGGELTSQTQTASRVDTGQTKGSYTYKVNSSGKEVSATVGSDHINAIYEEFGTGEYAVKGDGRKDPWTYKGRDGRFHRTRGKAPNKPMEKAFLASRARIIKRIESILRGLT